jgi:hypothetical protein
MLGLFRKNLISKDAIQMLDTQEQDNSVEIEHTLSAKIVVTGIYCH